jgi:glycosyltransferase involved in cell wall biosynthesis
VGDPYDVFAPGSVRHALRPFFRRWFHRQLRRQCVNACAVAYVTEHTLQRRYPPAPGAFSTHYSSIELPDAALVAAPRSPQPQQRRFTLIIVGTLAQLYKAPDVLIDAVGVCVREGLDLQLVLVGDGKHRRELETQASALGLDGRVRFLGQLPAGEFVRAQLDQADLFVLPSHQEGLPRAMIEAMARALPCIGSTAGGIPELLPPEDMVPPGDVTALARKIREVVTNLERMIRMSARNLEKAQEYRDEVLNKRRTAFYRYVRERTEAWLETQG